MIGIWVNPRFICRQYKFLWRGGSPIQPLVLLPTFSAQPSGYTVFRTFIIKRVHFHIQLYKAWSLAITASSSLSVFTIPRRNTDFVDCCWIYILEADISSSKPYQGSWTKWVFKLSTNVKYKKLLVSFPHRQSFQITKLNCRSRCNNTRCENSLKNTNYDNVVDCVHLVNLICRINITQF